MAIKANGQMAINNSIEIPLCEDFSGFYDNLKPKTTTVASAASVSLDMNNPFMTLAMSSNITFSATNIAFGDASVLILDRSVSGYTPTFDSDFQFAGGEPTWADSRYWNISLFATSATLVAVFANGFDG